jgi:hypothetical protein
LQYGFTYLKFPLWILNRIRLFFFHGSHTQGVGFSFSTVTSIYQEIAAAIIPSAGLVSLGLFFIGIVLLFVNLKKKTIRKPNTILLLWLLLPLFSFTLHSSPGQAYFTLLFPAISILIGYLIFNLSLRVKKIVILFTIFIVLINVISLFSNEFFVFTTKGSHLMPPMDYSLGYSWKLSDNASKAIVKDANGNAFSLEADGIFKLYSTSLDPYIYFTWFHGGNYKHSANLVYIITNNSKNLINTKIIYKSNFEYVARK